jgi:subtilisin-like proprotein convertase family protein
MLAGYSPSMPWASEPAQPALPPDPPFVSTQIVPPLNLDQTFLLHSRPGSSNVIFLDFDGHVTQNTRWNGDPTDPETYLPTIITPPYSTDANGLFTNQELANIQLIWARVVEDFAPFDVDVTTEDPGSDYIAMHGIRVIIGGVDSNWYSPPADPAGGVAGSGFADGTDTGCFAFSGGFGGNVKSTAEVISHEVGHTLGLAHWGQVLPGGGTVEYYGGDAGWAPIMGVGYNQTLVTWSKGEYHLAQNMPIPDPPNVLQDDLAVISATLPFLDDDHGDDVDDATPLQFTGTAFFGEGLITGSEGFGNNDVDVFSFDLSVEEIVFQIQPAHYGFNLDIGVTLYDANGEVVEVFDEVDFVDIAFSINTIADPDTLLLSPGRYYLAIDGVGRPFTTGQGFSDYGSLGYFSINADRKSHLADLIGVDFDEVGGLSPLGWTTYTGSNGPAVLSDIKNESGIITPINLAIRSSNGQIGTFSDVIDLGTVPVNPVALDTLDGFVTDSDVTYTFTWGDLDPLGYYEVYVFGLSDTDASNVITIAGEGAPVEFTQGLADGQLYVNGEPGVAGRQLLEYARILRATEAGIIEITVSSETNLDAAIAGLAIRPTTPGSIEGVVWNDENADGIFDDDELGLPNWTVFIDENNNGVLDTALPQTVASLNIPLEINDYTAQKSQLLFQGIKSIADVDVTVNITHTFDSDVNVYLTSPSGTRIELFTDIGLDGQNFTNTTLDDEATVSITAGLAPFTGSFRPEQALSAFDGEDANGIWILEVTDDATQDNGILHDWSLTITGSEQFTTTNAQGQYTFDDLIPGQYDIREVLQTGWTPTLTPPPVTVTSGAEIRFIDFGNTQGAVVVNDGTIEGQKWNDLNGDGIKDPGEPGLEGWTIYFDSNNNHQFDSAATLTFASTDVDKAITDFSTVISELEIQGISSIVDLNVTLNIAHTFDADLDVYLVSPSGTQVELFTGIGGQFDNFTNTVFDDEAAVYAPVGAAPFTGSFRPEGLLGDFDGETAEGIWKLIIRDTAQSDAGTLVSWSLTIVGEERNTTTDIDGNYEFNNLPAGTYTLREVMQPSWVQTHAPLAPIALVENGLVSNVDFGNQQLLLGDFNRDGTVDSSDFIIWRRTSGTTVPAYSGADGDGDGTIDADDLVVWRANFGKTMPGSGAGSGSALAAGASGGMATPESQPVAVGGSVGTAPGAGSGDAGGVAFAGGGGDTSAPSGESSGMARSASSASQAPAATPSAPTGGFAFAFAVTGTSASSSSSRPVLGGEVASSSTTDNALLAWLDQSTGSVGLPSDEDAPFEAEGDVADEADAAFEALVVALL